MGREPYYDAFFKYNPIRCPNCGRDAYEKETASSTRQISCKCYDELKYLNVSKGSDDGDV